MESNFHVEGELAGGQSYYAGVMTPTMGLDEAYINGCYSGIGFQAILQPFPSPVLTYSPCAGGVCFHSPTEMEVPLGSAPTNFGFFNREFQAGEAPKAIEFFNEDIKPPKQEALSAQEMALELLRLNTPTITDNAAASAGPLINFFATSSSANTEISMHNGDSHEYFTQLPLLESLERQESPAESQNAFKINQNHLLKIQFDDSSASISLPNNRVNNSSSASISRHLPYSSSELARKRRHKISEKTRCLQKLLPWDKKMDMATMLEEAHKYIKFLQAQIRVLQSMPTHSSGGNPNPSNEVKNENISSSSSSSRNDVVYGDLGRLNRQQLLEVVVNSPVAQTVLYSRGCCVYSMEQLLLLKKMGEKKALLEQMLLSSFQYQP